MGAEADIICIPIGAKHRTTNNLCFHITACSQSSLHTHVICLVTMNGHCHSVTEPANILNHWERDLFWLLGRAECGELAPCKSIQTHDCDGPLETATISFCFSVPFAPLACFLDAGASPFATRGRCCTNNHTTGMRAAKRRHSTSQQRNGRSA